jgi:transposase, IS5 family
MPRAELCAVLAAYYPKDPAEGEGGRRPPVLERMLCIHLLQQWYALADPGVDA